MSERSLDCCLTPKDLPCRDTLWVEGSLGSQPKFPSTSRASVSPYIRYNKGSGSKVSKAPARVDAQEVLGGTVTQAEGQRGLGRSRGSSQATGSLRGEKLL